MVLPDKDMPAAEPPAVTMADVKTTPAEAVTAVEQPPADEPPVTIETEEEKEPPPPPVEPVAPELPDLSLVAEMEAILASEGEVLSPIPDDGYELLWGTGRKQAPPHRANSTRAISMPMASPLSAAITLRTERFN